MHQLGDMDMRSNVTGGYAAIVAAGLAMLLAGGIARAQINTTVTTATSSTPVTFPWRAGSLAVGSFDGVTADAALPGVYICGIVFLLPSGQQWVSTGAGPVALVAADLDGDGDVDVAVAEQDGGSVSILTNDGLGGFTRTASYATGDPAGPLYPTGIAAADLSGDGKMDLVVVNRGVETVVVLRNTGGGFVISQVLPVSGEPNALVVGDFDKDGWMDVAVACAADDTVKVYRNHQGWLTPAGTFEGGPAPEAIAAADLDNDGNLDLAVADRESPQVTVLLNDGKSGFTSKEVFLSEPYARFETPVDLQLVDMDKDGLIDIRCAGATVLNRGGGNFDAADANALAGAVYGQGLIPGDPMVYLGIAYTAATTPNAVSVGPPDFQLGLIHVSAAGDDANDGLTWATAKRTVQAGLNAAQAGRQVWVAAGTYVENITLKAGVALYGGFAGYETKMYQRDWTANQTILDGNQAGCVVTAPSGATQSTRIDGFVIRNGAGAVYPYCGGILCSAASPTIANNTITGNSGTDGAGISSEPASIPLIVGNTITGNTGGGINCYGGALIINNSITNNTGGGVLCYIDPVAATLPEIISNKIAANGGSGIYCDAQSASYVASPLIVGNTITDNIASSSGGGGICYLGSSTVPGAGTIANNVITGNVSAGTSSIVAGGGIYCYFASPAIAGNTIMGNNAYKGGGIYCYYASPAIASNVIAGNSASRYGGGICSHISYSPTIANNTIVGNYAKDGGGIYCVAGTQSITNTIIAFNSSGICASSTTTLRYDCVYGNIDYNYYGATDPTGTNGNISVDPGLAQMPYVNVHIQPGSPCVDAGDDAVVKSDWVDMDGQPRKQGVHVDIGADESDGTVWPAVPGAIVRVSPSGNNANDGSSWLLAKRTVQAGIVAAAQTAGQVWVAAGTYVENITLPQAVAVYGGFAGSETDLQQRNWTGNPTILEGKQIAGSDPESVVLCRPGVNQATRIDGFTIRKGRGTFAGVYSDPFGGGIYCGNHSSPTIANNTITGNDASFGGGIGCYSYSSPTIVNNTITDNGAYQGSGICCYSYSSPMIVSNSIAGNTGSSPYATGVFCRDYSSPTIANNMIVGNQYSGIRCFSNSNYCSPTITNTTIMGNGGGISGVGASTTIVNTIVAFNGSGISVISGTTTLRHNCVYGNVNGAGTVLNYINVTDPTGTNGNISVDPLFVRPPSIGPDGFWGTPDDDWGDPRLLPGSPCIDAGSNADVPADICDLDGDGDTAELLPFDLAGTSRVVDDPYTPDTGSGTAPIVDIGAYEHHCGDANGDGRVDVTDLLSLVYSFGTFAGDAAFDATCDFNHDGAVDVADLLDLVYAFGT
jgi:parallel beta-helix repeat protein